MGNLHRTADNSVRKIRRGWLLGTALGGLAVAAGVSVWPSALAIRAVFARGARRTVEEMLPYAPADGVDVRRDLSFLPDEPGAKASHWRRRRTRDTAMDVFFPGSSIGRGNPGGTLPVVVWIHGGAWISGSKEDVAPYLRMIADEGYAAVGLNYPISPGNRYPEAVKQVTDALKYLVSHAQDLNIDPRQLILAGDSAGAQLASQLAAMVTNPAYARQVGIDPGIAPESLRGVVLNCGVYDLEALSRTEGLIGWGFKTALWAYAGKRDWSGTAAAKDMSTLGMVTRDFPPTYISGGNGDGLTATQSIPMSERLEALGVPVTKLFWPREYVPQLGHEYQFHLQLTEARVALQETLKFIKSVTGAGGSSLRAPAGGHEEADDGDPKAGNDVP